MDAGAQERVVDPGFLTISNVAKRFPDGNGGFIPAVRSFSLSIAKGEFVTILGPSGCGKTTTLRIVGGLETPDSGDVLLDGKRINQLPAQERNMPLVFQSYVLFPHLDVYENIAYGLRLRGLSGDVIENDVEMSLQLVNLFGLEKRFPNTLSGGQQQRVALARALVLKPTVLLFDEPLSNLDTKLRGQMRGEIKRIQSMLGITTLYVTHDQSEALGISDRVVVMHHGQVEQVGTPEEVYGSPRSLFVADFVGNANFIEARIAEVTDTVVMVQVQGKYIEVPRYCRNPEFREGDEVYLVTKPEAVHLSIEGSNDGSGFTGRLVNRFFMGASVEYEVEFENGFLTAVQMSRDGTTVSVGTTVNIEFEVEHFRLFRKSDQPL